MNTIPIPECPYGYPDTQIREILGTRYPEFCAWMYGQTMSICDGRRYNHETKQYEPTSCSGAPHGPITYASDLNRFLRNLPIID